MKGATGDPWAKISSIAKRTITTNIGMSHQSLRFQRKEKSSPTMPIRVVKPPCDLSDTFDLHEKNKCLPDDSTTRQEQ
jgi:hypothetical protein